MTSTDDSLYGFEFESVLLELRARHAAAPAGSDTARTAARELAFRLADRNRGAGTSDDLDEIIGYAEEALGGSYEGGRTELRCIAAEALRARWNAGDGTGTGTDDLDRAIDHLTAAARDDPLHEEVVQDLGTTQLLRAEALPEGSAERRDALDRSVAHLRTARARTPEPTLSVLYMLGVALAYRVEEHDEDLPDEREEAIGCLVPVWHELPAGDDTRISVAEYVADLHFDAYLCAEEQDAEVAALTRAIEWYRRVEGEPSDWIRFRHGTALVRRRFLEAGEPGDDETARGLLTGVLPELPREPAARANRELGDLAMARTFADPDAADHEDDLTEAVTRYRAALLDDAVPDWNGPVHACIADALSQLAPAEFNSLAEIQELVDHASTAWRMLAPGPDRLGPGLCLFAVMGGIWADLIRDEVSRDLLDVIVEVCQEIGPEFDEEMRRENDDPARGEFRVFHGTMLAHRGDLRDDHGDLAAAERLLDAAYELVDLDAPEEESTVLLLAGGYATLATNVHGPKSTQRAEYLLRRLLRQEPGNLDLRHVFASVLAAKASNSQNTLLLDEAIREFELLHADYLAGDGNRLKILQVLAPLYQGRAGRSGRMDHMEKMKLLNRELPTLAARSDVYADENRIALMAVNAISEMLAEAASGKREPFMRDRLEKADALLRSLPADSLIRKRIGDYRQLASWAHDVITHSGATSDIPAMLSELSELSEHLLEEPQPGAYEAMRRNQRAWYATRLAQLGRDQHDLSLVFRAMEHIPELPSGASDEDLAQLVLQAGGAAVAYMGWHISRDAEWLRDALRRFQWLIEQPGLPAISQVGMRLNSAMASRDLGDRAKARDLVLAALHHVGRLVLLQPKSDDVLQSVRQIGSLQETYARWFVDDDDPEGLVSFLEHTRGLVLHAATSVTGITELLERTDREDLAEQWRASPHAHTAPLQDFQPTGDLLMTGPLAELGFHDDLRNRVIDALAATPEAAPLFTPPARTELAGALTETGADALVYLVPPVEGRPGAVVMLTAEGAIEWIPTPNFTAGPMRVLDQYADEQRAYLDLLGTPGEDNADDEDAEACKEAVRAAVQRVERSLGQLCDWAWFAVMREVVPAVRRLRPAGAEPRVVLVPTGRLGMVPWHAARRVPRAGGAPRYALHDLVISYAATGRQLMDVAGRPARPLAEEPVIISPELRDLPMGWFECAELRDRFYPDAVVYGRDAPGKSGLGTPGQLRRHFPGPDRPGASLLHSGCHAVALPDQPTESYLKPLRDSGQVLRISHLLRDAHGRDPRAPGGTIVLASCTSDLTRADHDEVLTLATGFLTLGAVTVIGTRWAVSDPFSAVLSVRIHELLAAGRPPRDALREAQLWMIDGAQGPGGPTDPALRAVVDGNAESASGLRLHNLLSWAGFTHQGR
ncbi:CHAT domain-containing protein [Actinomadura sp. GC306]|uniref:CHAT domain-containing protein n=1 Tax=Actinomadura sp. GC306 TaxID=2530367 RepID=UPI00104A3B36|nr:CHAT domain-containing protein [Actinomadura sp. GC306]TDC70802.1 CHAT domain-containing protein [Actinomadura sp. GC306]